MLFKGSRDGVTTDSKYREAMYYSRLADLLEPDVRVPKHYFAGMDPDTTDSFLIEEFMEGY